MIRKLRGKKKIERSTRNWSLPQAVLDNVIYRREWGALWLIHFPGFTPTLQLDNTPWECYFGEGFHPVALLAIASSSGHRDGEAFVLCGVVATHILNSASMRFIPFLQSTMQLCITFISLLLPVAYALCQGPTAAELALFPLNVGDHWQYRYHIVGYNQDTTSTYSETIVVADTLMPGGKRYKTLRDLPSGSLSFMRVDSSSGNVYRFVPVTGGEVLTDSLRARVRDTVAAAFIWCSGSDSSDVLCVRVRMKVFSALQSWGGWSHFLGEGFGIIQRTKVEDNPYYPLLDHYYYDLVYARVAGRNFGTLVGVQESPRPFAGNYQLLQNFPNPFNPSTTIQYSSPHRAYVTLAVFNTLGQKVAELVNGEIEPGTHEVKFDGSRLASGVYFYRMQAGEFVNTKSFVLMR